MENPSRLDPDSVKTISPAENVVVVPADELRNLVRDVLKAAGADQRNADRVAEALVSSNLCGVETHGVWHLAGYVNAIKSGDIVPTEWPEIISETPTTALVSGNWTFGQNLGHLATWADYCYDGIPMKIPFFVRWIIRPLRNRLLTQPLKPGTRIPRVSGGTLATDIVSTQQGLHHFTKAFDRLANEVPPRPSPLFGRLTHDQWIAFNLRHAELHLSFLHPE